MYLEVFLNRKEEKLSKKIKIAFVAPKCYSLFYQHSNQGFGGAEVDLYNLAIYLSKNPDFEVEFYVGDYGDEPKQNMVGNINVRKIKLFGYLGKSLSEKIIFYSNLAKELYTSKSDIMITEMANSIVGWAAIFFKAGRKNKYLIHRLASDMDTNPEFLLANDKKTNYNLYIKGLKNSDKIFSQTQRQQKLLKDNMGFDSDIAPNGFFIKDNPDFEKKDYILWVGRKTKVKRPDLLIELVKRCPNQKFVMIMLTAGQIDTEEFKKNTDILVEEAKKLPNFSFHTYIPFSQIQQYYDNAKALVNTSDYEGFPNIFIQSCIGATPILSLNVNPDNFIEKNKLGVFANGDIKVLIDYIQKDDYDKMVYYGSNALNYVKEHHDIGIMGKIYEKTIMDFMKGK